MIPNPIRILIVEDHPIYRMGLKELINAQSDMTVCAEAEDVRTAINYLQELSPAFVIVDLTLKNSNGLDLIKAINSRGQRIPALVLSMHDESVHAQRCLAAGACGYIMKQEASTSVVKAVRHILAGNCYVSQRVMTQLINRKGDSQNTGRQSPVDCLTDRELEIFQWIGKGFSSGRIAAGLNLSVKTVGTHKERIKEKLCFKDGGELVRCAVLWTAEGNLPETDLS